jgi:hypothetical protein
MTLGIVVVAVGAALGVGYLLDDARRDATAQPTAARDAQSPAEPGLAVRPAPVPPDPAQHPDAADLLAQSLGEKIDPATQAAVRQRAADLRKYALRLADTADKLAADEWAASIRKERAERDDRMRGGTMAFLQGLAGNWTPQSELVRSPEKFGALFLPQVFGGVVDGASILYGQATPSGTTIRFPAGQFALDVRAMNCWWPFPKDLVLQGAGMDATLLVANSDLDVRESVTSLTLRDLTIHTNDEYLDRLRDAPYTIRMERCRVVGFDMGAGQSSMLGGSVGAFYARGCRFEAGFGRSPGSGVLFDVRGMLLARLENCDVVGPFRSVFAAGRATQVFANCRFTKMSPRTKTDVEGTAGAAEFSGCTFQYLANDWDSTARAKRSVSEFNPAWKDPKR